MTDERYGILWQRDIPGEDFMITLLNAFKHFEGKFKVKPDECEISLKDKQEEFEFDGVLCKPAKRFGKGYVWMTLNGGVKRLESK